MGSGWGSNLTIAQDANRLTVEYAFFGRGDMQPAMKFVYSLDGSETRNSVMMGRGVQEQISRTKWEGDSLLTTIHTFTNPATGQPITQEVIQKLSLNSPVFCWWRRPAPASLEGPPRQPRRSTRNPDAAWVLDSGCLELGGYLRRHALSPRIGVLDVRFFSRV